MLIIPEVRNDSYILTDSDLYSELIDFLHDARKEIIFLSPLIELTGHQEDLIKGAISNDVMITLLTRSPRQQRE